VPPVDVKPLQASRTEVGPSGATMLLASQPEAALQPTAAVGSTAQPDAQEPSVLARLWRYLLEGGTAPRHTLHGS
jgi:hypothetical protein